jgi:hypothetical protein
LHSGEQQSRFVLAVRNGCSHTAHRFAIGSFLCFFTLPAPQDAPADAGSALSSSCLIAFFLGVFLVTQWRLKSPKAAPGNIPVSPMSTIRFCSDQLGHSFASSLPIFVPGLLRPQQVSLKSILTDN